MGNSTQPQNSDVTATGSKKTLIVKTESGDVIVRKLAFIDYGQLLRAIKKLPTFLGGFIDGTSMEEFQSSSTADILLNIMPLLADSWSDLVGIVAVATDKDAEFIGSLEGAEGIEVVAAVLDLNSYKKIAGAIKKLMPQKPKTETSESPDQNETSTTK